MFEEVKVIFFNNNWHIFFTELFDNYMQQDAHEFLNYLLNTIADLLQGEFIWCTNKLKLLMIITTDILFFFGGEGKEGRGGWDIWWSLDWTKDFRSNMLPNV